MLGTLITLIFLAISCLIASHNTWRTENDKMQRWTAWIKNGKAAECHLTHLKVYSDFKVEIDRKEKSRKQRCRLVGNSEECLFNLIALDPEFDHYTKFGDKEIRKVCGDEFFDLRKPDTPRNLASIYWDQVNTFGLDKVGFFALLSALGIFAFLPIVSARQNNL